MVIAMAGFTANDALVKSVTGVMNVGQIMFVRGVMTTVLVLAIARHMGALRPLRIILSLPVVVRIAAEVGASLTYIAALGFIPLANASSILQSMPLAITLGAALFLGEPVGWRRWLAIAAGFCGVLIVIRPGPEGFTIASALVVASVIFATIRDLATRKIGGHVPTLFISVITAVAITLFGCLLIVPLGGWQPVEAGSLVRLLLASILVLVGYQFLVMAMRSGEVSFISPFRYASLLFAILIGMLAFSEKPDAWMLTGIVIIVASGLYTFYRENKRKVALAQQSLAGTPS